MHFKVFLLLLLLLQAQEGIASFWSFGWWRDLFHSGAPLLENATDTSNGMNKDKNNEDRNAFDLANISITIKRSSNDYTEVDPWDVSAIPANCDEDSILVPLARLRIVSPEKIIELLSTSSLEYTCERVNSSLKRLKKAISDCRGFPKNHLYQKLCNGLEYFRNIVCMDLTKEDKKHHTAKSRLIDHWECYSQLQDDLFDCEGPPDWFEKKNRSIACQFYNDVIDCNYIKAAMLCGKAAAKLLRDFSDAIMRQVLTFRCKVSHSYPHVDNPMLVPTAASRAVPKTASLNNLPLISYFHLIFKYLRSVILNEFY